MNFYFKNEYYGDDWQYYQGSEMFHDDVAQDLAETWWRDDPSDPSHFNFEVEVKDEHEVIKKFVVNAEADVNFWAVEIKK